MDKLQSVPEVKDVVRGRMGLVARQDAAALDSNAVLSVMGELEERVRAHPAWADASREELEGVAEGVEKLVTVKLFEKLFAATEEDQALDASLRTRIASLQFLQPGHLDVPWEWVQEGGASLSVAKNELCKMSVYKSPKDKLVCIFNCCKLAAKVLATSAERTTGADELLPLLIFLLIQANPPRLHSNLSFIYRYRHPSRLLGEQGYFLTNIMSAQSFLETVCTDDGELRHEKALSISKEEFKREYLVPSCLGRC